jgi:hypothetical protein
MPCSITPPNPSLVAVGRKSPNPVPPILYSQLRKGRKDDDPLTSFWKHCQFVNVHMNDVDKTHKDDMTVLLHLPRGETLNLMKSSCLIWETKERSIETTQYPSTPQRQPRKGRFTVIDNSVDVNDQSTARRQQITTKV